MAVSLPLVSHWKRGDCKNTLHRIVTCKQTEMTIYIIYFEPPTNTGFEPYVEIEFEPPWDSTNSPKKILVCRSRKLNRQNRSQNPNQTPNHTALRSEHTWELLPLTGVDDVAMGGNAGEEEPGGGAPQSRSNGERLSGEQQSRRIRTGL
jgi:hypothetical protein